MRKSTLEDIEIIKKRGEQKRLRMIIISPIIIADYHLLKSLKFIRYIERLMCLFIRGIITHNSSFSFKPFYKEFFILTGCQVLPFVVVARVGSFSFLSPFFWG